MLVSVNRAALVRLAREHDCVLVLVPRVGDFVPGGGPLFTVHPAASATQEVDQLAAHLVQEVALDTERTMEQDIAFGFRQLIDIAQRAVSPAVNDLTTASQVLDALHDLLRRLATRHLPDGWLQDDSGTPRVLVPQYRFADYLSITVAEIWRYGADAVQIPGRMSVMLTDLAGAALPSTRAPSPPGRPTSTPAPAAGSANAAGDPNGVPPRRHLTAAALTRPVGSTVDPMVPYDRVVVVFNPASTGQAPHLAQRLRTDLTKRLPGTEVLLGKGSLGEIVSVVRTFSRFRPFAIELPDGTRRRFDSILFANIAQMAKYATLSEHGRPDDGRFEVITLPHVAKWRVLGTAVKAAVHGLLTVASACGAMLTVTGEPASSWSTSPSTCMGVGLMVVNRYSRTLGCDP